MSEKLHHFTNLAGVEQVKADADCLVELHTAHIDVVRLPWTPRGEVSTDVLGELNPWSFTRAWRYWVARGPGIPVDLAEELHTTHGTQVRVGGHCGCPSPTEWFKGFGVGVYHIDTWEGLAALATLIKKIRGEV